MPSDHAPSQPDNRLQQWVQSGSGRRLVANIQSMVIPELTRVFGQHGLYLRPDDAISVELSGNMLGHVVSLHRDKGALAGQLKCRDGELPIGGGSLSLVYSLFMLESSPEPELLVQEVARSLKPEGVALLISLNPFGLARLRWLLQPLPATSGALVERLALDAGLEVVRRQYIGPFWPSSQSQRGRPRLAGWLDPLRAANMVVLRRREVGMTPLRKAAAAVSLRPGMSAG